MLMKNWSRFSFFIVALLWGSSFAFQKTLLEVINPFTFTFWNFTIACLALSLVAFAKRTRILYRVREGVVLGSLLACLEIFQMLGLRFSTPANTAFISNLGMLLIPYAGFVLFRHKVSAKHNAAIALGNICAAPRQPGANCDRAVATLLNTLKVQDEFLPSSIAKALGEIGDPRAIIPLTEFVQDSSRSIYTRESAARALGRINGEQARTALIMIRENSDNEDIRSLLEIILYGLKGMAAYADHAFILGKTDETVMGALYKGLAAMQDKTLSADALVALAMELGQANLKCMELLDNAHTSTFGNPTPTKVTTGVKKGPAIIISGHDLHDLKQLLEQTKGTGVNIYTHGEMLPAHGYPELNKYPHLAGHFGTAWQNQQKEFDGVPAAILFSTNCIQRPMHSYKDRLFTTGLVAWPEIEHIEESNGKKDFSAVIKKAVALGGFSNSTTGKELLVGFGHNTILSLADKIIAAVKNKTIRHFFLIGGCDGARPGRNYYTEFAQKVPADSIILTLACGKFRFNDLDFGTVGEFPRLLDIGQCNDAYSAIKVAAALAKAFNCGLNELPLSLILSWYEQKAVVILLTLLSLGIKNIRLGPTLPAFISPNVLNILVEKFAIKPITTPEEDLTQILQ